LRALGPFGSVNEGRILHPPAFSQPGAKEKRDKGALAPFFSKKKEELVRIFSF